VLIGWKGHFARGASCLLNMIEVLGRLSFRFFTDKKEREKET
jgi:hypothetical protein